MSSPSTRALRVALLGEVVEQGRVLALATAHHRGEDLETGALGQVAQAVDDLLRALAGDETAAVGAVRLADTGIEQAQVVVDLGDRPDRGPGVARGGLLVDRDRRRQPFDEVDVRLVHLAEELAGIRRQRLHISSLALGVDRVERERRLARAGKPCEDDEPVAGQLKETFFKLCSRAPRTTRVLGTGADYRLVGVGRPLPTMAGVRAERPRSAPLAPRARRKEAWRLTRPP